MTCGLYVHVGKGTCAPEEFPCPSFNGTASRCISNSWKCDGQKDCVGGEDEIGCSKLECPTGTFNCTGENVCLTTAWQCDGDVDCSSGDDEANCDSQPTFIDIPPRLLFSNRYSIRMLSLDTASNYEVTSQKRTSALDMDYRSNTIFYYEMEENKIGKLSLPTANQTFTQVNLKLLTAINVRPEIFHTKRLV